VGARRSRERLRGDRSRIGFRRSDEPRGSARTHEVRHIEFGIRGGATELVGEMFGVGIGEDARHHGIGGRVLTQRHDLAAHRRIVDDVAAIVGLGDGVGVAAIADERARLFQGAEPGPVDELEQPARRGRRCRRIRIEVRFDLGGRQQIAELGAGNLRCLADRIGHRAVSGRSRRKGGIDRHDSNALIQEP